MYIGSLVLLLGCKTYIPVEQSNTQTFEQVAYEKFRSDTLNYYSPERSYVLCIRKSKEPQFPDQAIEYFVFDLKKRNIVLETKGSNMKISWYSDSELLFRIQPGIRQTPEEAGVNVYTYNLLTKEKSYINKNKINQ